MHEAERLRDAYAELYDFAPVGFLTLDRQGTIRQANLKAAGLLGTERSRLVGARLAPHLMEPGQALLTELLDRCGLDNTPSSCDLACQPGIGRAQWLRVEATCEASSTQEFRLALLDITDEVQAERELRSSEARYRSLFDLSPDPIALSRLAEDTLLEVNPA